MKYGTLHEVWNKTTGLDWEHDTCSLHGHSLRLDVCVRRLLQRSAPVVAVCYDLKLLLDGKVEESPVLKPVFLNNSLRHPMVRH